MLHARTAGQGRAVVLLHAFPLNSRMWEPQFAAFRQSARLIAPDFPGFGLSGAAGNTQTLESYARKVRRLLDHERVTGVVVVGLSMGGYVAFRLATELGARLEGLLLADTRPTADSEQAAVARHELAAEVESQGVEVAASEFLPKLLGPTTVRSQPDLIDRVHRIMLENSVTGVAGALRAMAARGDVSAMLPRLTCPVACVVGEEDLITPPDVMRAMAAQINGASVEVIAQAGHLTNLEAPEAFNEALAALLARVHPASAG
jgi:pimeloyl-ACP methyl ester carboxylesterase